MATRTRSTASTTVLDEAPTTTTRGKGKVAAAPAPAPVDDLELDEDDYEDVLGEGEDLLDDEEDLEDEELDDIAPDQAPPLAPAVDPSTLTPEQRAENVAARIVNNIHSKTGFSLQADPTKGIEKAFIFGIAGLVTSAALAQGLNKDKLGEVRASVLDVMGNPGSASKPSTPRDKETVQRTMANMAVWIAFARKYHPLSSDDTIALHQILELNARDLQRANSTMARNGNNNGSSSSSSDLY